MDVGGYGTAEVRPISLRHGLYQGFYVPSSEFEWHVENFIIIAGL